MQRHTKQRAAIQQALEDAQRPLLPLEILHASQVLVPQLNLATVYRNLNTLVADGVATAVHLPNQATRFERMAHHHHHFLCEQCDRVFDIHHCSSAIDQLAPKGFAVARHDLTLYGACPDCAPQTPALAS